MDLRHTAVLMLAAGTILVSVHSQAVCSPGWFGSRCQYKCRCSDNKCTTEGVCGHGVPCERGWFGPACQYADLAYGGSSARETTDGDDTTCLDPSKSAQVTVALQHRYHVTWLRVRLSKPDLLYNLTAHFRKDASLSCTNPRTARVDSTTLDIHCDPKETVDHVFLMGEGVQHLCSVYISGGRNVALRQNSSHSSTYWEKNKLEQNTNRSYPSEKAVDGNSDSVFYRDHTCSHTVPGDSNPNLNISFSKLQHVTRYVLYNRHGGASYRLNGFKLRSYGPSMTPVFHYTDRSQDPQLVYTVVPDQVTPPIRLVNVAVNNSEGILTLCELKVYGDTVCQSGNYGRECEHMCNCDGGQSCFVSTGGCPVGCAAGFQGQDCRTVCDVGSYGPGCQLACSQFCVRDCDSRTHFCDNTNGTCLYGCQSGYLGSNCSQKLPSKENMDVAVVVVPVVGGVNVLVIVVVAVVFRRRRQTTKTERHVDSAAKSTDNTSLSRNGLSKVHRTLSDGGHDIPGVSTAITQMVPLMGPQEKIDFESMFGDDCVAQSCDNCVVHTHEDIDDYLRSPVYENIL